MTRTTRNNRSCVVQKKVGDVESQDESSPSGTMIIPLGSKVEKFFPGFGMFQGKVTSYRGGDDPELIGGLYKVVYEDGDVEEYDAGELRAILISKQGELASSSDEDQEEEEEEEDANDDIESEYSGASSSGDDDDDSSEECEIVLPIVTSSPAKRHRRGGVSAAAVVTVTPSPKKKKKKRSAPLPPPPALKKNDPHSVAVRGLPRGALARQNGLTIRALESVRPLDHEASSHYYCHPATVELPCPFLVVTPSQDDWFPPDFVGKTFTSAKEFHGALSKRSGTTRSTERRLVATYEMVAVADPPFASREFTSARLVSAGLLGPDAGDEAIFVVRIEWDGELGLSSSISYYKDEESLGGKSDDVEWALIEGDRKDLPSVMLGVPTSLIGDQHATEEKVMSNDTPNTECGTDLLPRPSSKVSQIRLPASLLQKAMRRGSLLCSPTPLLEACSKLLLGQTPRGSILACLKAIWGCMLVDASPFDDGEGCLGLPSLLLLSLVAKADPDWKLPSTLRRAVVAAALRTASVVTAQPWVGFVDRDDDWWKLENAIQATDLIAQKALNLRNIIRVTQSVAGGRLAWGKWNAFIGDTTAAAALAYLNWYDWKGSHLPEAPASLAGEKSVIQKWERGEVAVPCDTRLLKLDNECRLAAIEPSIMPYTLVLLQACLQSPPVRWKKHSLPALSRQVRKLISEANPRFQERVQLARLATWGKDPEGVSVVHSSTLKVVSAMKSSYSSYREVVTPTGKLSSGEIEIVDCFEAIESSASSKIASDTSPEGFPQAIQHIQAGPSLTQYDGRIAFILAFASAIEIEVTPDPNDSSKKETVSAMFCGDIDEPLLVQRIGMARKEGKELATTGGATSGAAAVPSLGYVQRNRSKGEQMLMAAAELAVAKYWHSVTLPMPLPPMGMQWDIPGGEEQVTRSAKLVDDGSGGKVWQFAVGGVKVEPFDARSVISACALTLDDPKYPPVPLDEGTERYELLRAVLYVEGIDGLGSSQLFGKAILDAMSSLHSLAEADRNDSNAGPSEGIIYDWIPLATKSIIPSHTWRDILLAIRTRDTDHVVLGKGVCNDGTGTPRDMTEGVLLRVFHGLEMLYPTALRKEGAMKFRIRPRGAGYYHLLICLERLGRDELRSKISSHSGDLERKRKTTEMKPDGGSAKRPRRAAALASEKASRQISLEWSTDTKAHSRRRQIKFEDEEDFEIENDLDEVISESTSDEEDCLPLPQITTHLWDHQEASVSKVVEGVQKGRRGHADASAVGAGKTLTALATVVRLAKGLEESGHSRHGVLIMLPTKALIREWLLEIATHTKRFHVVEQREDGSLFSLTYAKSHPPIDANTIVISTLDRVCRHPFVRQAAWDFVIVDECLSVQNAAAKRTPSAWRQIEVSTCGVLMLSATFFRSKYDQLFYMIRMLRSPLPPTLPWLPATIHEHIVCQVPETDRSWTMKGEMVALSNSDLQKYRRIVEAFQRKQINEPGEADGRKLWVDLEKFLRSAYEGRASKSTYLQSSVMSDAFAHVAKSLLRKGRKPLIFADTSQEADFLVRALRACGLDTCTWASVSQEAVGASGKKDSAKKRVIVAVKTVEGQGINMQRHADTIICRPTPGDHLEQMKGRIDRPGQTTKDLLLVVLMAEHTIEEAKFSNIRLAGNFFREYIAPVATKYRERIDLEATLAVVGTKKLKKGTVSGAWMRSLEEAGQSGAFAQFCEDSTVATSTSTTASIDSGSMLSDDDELLEEDTKQPAKKKKEIGSKYKPLNKVKRNKGDPRAVKQAKALAKQGQASLTVRNWLFPPTKSVIARRDKGKAKALPKESLMRFSDTTPPVVLDRNTIAQAVTHLSQKDPKLAALIARVGADALANDCGTPRQPTQARLFDKCIRSITFTMVSVDAGNSFLRRLAIKAGVCIERKTPSQQKKLLQQIFKAVTESGEKSNVESPTHLLELLLAGRHREVLFSYEMVQALVHDCEKEHGKRTGYPHLCGVTHPCGKNDDHSVFLDKARAAFHSGGEPVSAGYSRMKADFIISLVHDFETGKISGEKIAKASDRQAAKMLMELKGIGDWCAGGVLMQFLSRADIMLYGDLTVRNFLNDLYDINHHFESETLLESAADFADNATNRNLIDEVAEKNEWAPYRSVVCYLMYHLQEENLVLL